MAELKSELLFEMTVDLAEPQVIGDTPHGNRQIIYVTGGSFEGPRLKGEVLPGGGDWLIARPDGALELDIRATVRTDDGDLIYTYYRGIIHAAPEVIERLFGGAEMDPSEYYFRASPVFETASEKYGWLNRIVAVGVGWAHLPRVGYSVYEIK
jgi:hypothetical protein